MLRHSPSLLLGDQLRHIQTRVRPRFHVFGHIHEGYGVSSDGVTTYINASSCNYNYRPLNPPVIFDIPSRDQTGI